MLAIPTCQTMNGAGSGEVFDKLLSFNQLKFEGFWIIFKFPTSSAYDPSGDMLLHKTRQIHKCTQMSQ